jgi:hypothetical protein
MKNIVKFVMIVVAVSLISSAAYAEKGDEGRKPDKEKTAAVDSKQAQDAAKEAKDVNDKAAQKADRAGKEVKDKAKDANTAGAKKKTGQKEFLGFKWGKDYQQQLKALDVKSARTDAKYKEKIGALEKKLAAALDANDTKKVQKLEKKIARTKNTSEKKMKKIEAKRDKIQAEMAKEK